MTIGEKGVCVRILEKEFRVACGPSQESTLREAAQYLDLQMRQIRRTGRVIGMERIAVMAALNIANELLTLKNSSPQASSEAFSSRLKVLQEKIDGVLTQVGATPIATPAEMRVVECHEEEEQTA